MVDASQTLGSPQIAGLMVDPKGYGAAGYAAAGHALGTAGMAAPGGRARRDQSLRDVVFDTPRPWSGLLALTEQELALVAGRGYSKVIARVPRSEIAFAKQYGHAFPASAPFVIVFKNGHGWHFEVRWTHARAAKKILPLLNAEQQAASQS